MTDLPVRVRDMVKDDLPFVLNSWKRSILYASPVFAWARMFDGAHKNYYAFVNEVCDHLAKTKTVRVCCSEPDTDHTVGWICLEHRPRSPVVHYAFVKQDYRHMGIFDLLCLDTIGVPVRQLIALGNKLPTTFWTTDAESLGIFEYRPEWPERSRHATKAYKMASKQGDCRENEAYIDRGVGL